MEIINRKANFNYFVEDTYECGIVLTGTEIKSIREGKADFNDSYGRIKDGEVFLINMYIAFYKEGSYLNHDERAERKLLLHKEEIIRIEREIKLNHKTLIPLKLYFVRGKAKVSLGICTGKKLYDKRETIKQRDIERRG